MNKSWNTPFFLALLLGAALLLSGCNALTRLSEVGSPPKLAAVQDPSAIPGPQPVRMPVPDTPITAQQPNSLWKVGSRAFFRDQRASREGDILTVVIDMDEKAKISNETKRSRANSEDANISALLGVESQFTKVLPEALDPTKLVETGSNVTNNGKGTVERKEKVELRVAATITQVLPNGNLVLAGRQQMTINFDMRELVVTGVVRPEDISAENTVSYDQIAEARISYGGRGQLLDIQQPRYGSQVLDVLMPF